MSPARGLSLAILTAVMLSVGCSQQQAPAPVDTRKAAEDAINATSEEFAKAVEAKDLDKIVSYYTDDAVLFVPSGPAAAGKDQLRKAWQGFISGPASKIDVSGTVIDVAASGDLAFERGNFTATMTDAKGKTTVQAGKLVDVWKKQADGSWKMAADTNASDK
ncbi:MAG TPA: SgcJ/EcaC family oxidoreductase [Verrucomicrobiae bacterium]|nr:SgcJ/EcaC family oxidoreductase [Verrucomicrobiae bacterium]